MKINQITLTDLRRMNGKEGLILQGCGGETQEWVDGINKMLTDKGILLDNTKFENVSVFKSDGVTCILYPFEDVHLDIGKLAMWRLQSYTAFAGMWLSDYVDNRLGGFEPEQNKAEKLKPDCALIGCDSNISIQTTFGLLNLLCMIAFAYCVIKIFFANIKRGGILLIQMAVGALYMFSVPRGYQDGFNQWMKQIAALCLTAFMQTTLLFLGLLTFPGNVLLGLGIMLASNEVPRIAQQFGLDSSVKVNMTSIVHATTTAVNLTRSVARAAK